MSTTPPSSTSFDASLLSTLEWLWQANLLGDARVEQRARELVVDTIGCAISGLSTAEVRNFAAALAAAEPGAHHLPGFPIPMSRSAFLYAFSAGACCFEGPEGLAIAEGRPGLHAVPAALAHATHDTTLRQLLSAIIVGFEVGGRIGASYKIRPGMHVDGTWGTFGATAAISHLANASPEQTLAAINHAACQTQTSLYYPITMGSIARNTYVGHGVANAAMSVIAAATGFGGPRGSLLEHAKLVLGREVHALSDQIGQKEWSILRGYLKIYPVVKHVHYGIYAGSQWRAAHEGIDTARISRVALKIYRNAMTYCGVTDPKTAIQAQFSLTWGLAWSLKHGTLTIDAFSPEGLTDGEVRRLERMIEVTADDELTAANKRGATLEVTCDGETKTYAVDGVPGDPDRPLTRAQIETKFISGALPVIGRPKAEAILGDVLDGALDAPFTLPR